MTVADTHISLLPTVTATLPQMPLPARGTSVASVLPQTWLPWAVTLTADDLAHMLTVAVSQKAAFDMAAFAAQTQQSLAAQTQQSLAAISDCLDSRPLISQAMLYDLGPVLYVLRFPLMITIEEYASEIVATIPEFSLYASAETPARAIALLKREIADTYAEYESWGMDKLGPPAQQSLLSMRQIIEQRHA